MAPSYGPSYPVSGPAAYSASALLGGAAIPSWVVNRLNPPDISLDFANNRAWKPVGGTSAAAALLTCSRGSVGYANDSAGSWTAFSANTPRITDLGLLVEESRTNSIRNNSMQGAVVMADNVELIQNTTFTPAGGANWTNSSAGTATANFTVAGKVTLTGDTVNRGSVDQQFSGLTVGKNYVVTATTTGSAGLVRVGTTQGGTDLLADTGGFGGTTPTVKASFTATQSSAWVRIQGLLTGFTEFALVSVQDGERCQNGGFTSNPINASQSTVQNGWQWKNNSGTGTAVYGSNSVTITGDGTNSAQISAAFPTLVGATYTITVDVGTGTCSVGAGSGAFSTSLLSVTSAVGTGQKFQFTATATTSYVTFTKSLAAASVVANVSVQSAGKLPTNWVLTSVLNGGPIFNITNVSTESGIDFVDVQLAGTTTSAASPQIAFESSSQIAASYGQTWTSSFFMYVSAGSLTNLTNFNNIFDENQSGGTFIASHGTSFTPSIVGPLGANRLSQSATINAANAGAVKPYISWHWGNAVAVNATFRIGWPQLENNSLINSTVASAVKAANGSGGVNGTAVYSVAGTGTAATLNCTWAAGVLTVNSVASAGSYTVFPIAGAALTYVSGTATGWTGATVNCTPTNLATNAFATSPIRTTAAAATRNADVVSLTSVPTFGSSYSFYVAGTPQAPLTYNGNQPLIQTDDGTANNRDILQRNNGSGTVTQTSFSGGTPSAGTGTAWAQNAAGKLASAMTNTDQAASFNGATPFTSAGALPAGTIANFKIGSTVSGTSFMDGFISSVAIWKAQRVPNAELQSMTT